MHNHLPSPVKYREDINGLRAWAVIGVLLFHFSLIGLPGGFAGVDVFFVISGYLMTAIIVGGYEKGSFSIWKFYRSRIRRILPALLVIIAVLLILGWFFLPTVDYQELGKQSAYSLGFLSNVGYLRTAGYFDTFAEEKWLLHTWSLAVEAQFYILYPILIIIVWKIFKTIKAMSLLIILVFISSLTLNLYLSSVNLSASFYLLPTRAWELAAGGLVYFAIKNNVASELFKSFAYWIGWVLIVGSFLFITEEMVWPGYWTILPVLGASLVILASKEESFFTNTYIAQWVGNRSYSLYLWHWPLVVILYFSGLKNEWNWVIGAFVLSILLAHFSYKYIEVPTRQLLSKSNFLKELIIIGLISLIVGSFSVYVQFKSFDENNRLLWSKSIKDQLVNLTNNSGHTKDSQCQGLESKCLNKKDDSLLLIGDSHAGAISGFLEDIAQEKNWSFSAFNHPGCPPIPNIIYNSFGLERLQNKFECKIKNNILFNTEIKVKTILLINRMPYYFYGPNDFGLEKFFGKPVFHFENERVYNQYSNEYIQSIKKRYTESLCQLKQHMKTDIYVARPIPEMVVTVPHQLRVNIVRGVKDEIKIPISDYHNRNRVVWEAQDSARELCGIKILNPLKYLCDDKYCYGSKNNIPLYRDSNHLNIYGNKLLIPMFEEVFKNDGTK